MIGKTLDKKVMNICKIQNYWYLPGWCQWENELSLDKGRFGDEILWINVEFHQPFSCNKHTFQKTLAFSAYNYASKFN